MSNTKNIFVSPAEDAGRPESPHAEGGVGVRYFKVPPKSGGTEAEQELKTLVQQRAAAEMQVEAWRATRIRNGDPVPSYEEQRLIGAIDLLRLQENNVRNWIASYVGQDPVRGEIQAFQSTPVPPERKKKKKKKSQSSNPAPIKKRSRGSGVRKKKSVTARDSPSRGISRTTGKRSRVRLIG